MTEADETDVKRTLADLKRRQQEDERRLEELIRANDLLGFLAECQQFGLDFDYPGLNILPELAKLQERFQSTGALSNEDAERYRQLWKQLRREAAAAAAKLADT
jgi:hypothetical protein